MKLQHRLYFIITMGTLMSCSIQSEDAKTTAIDITKLPTHVIIIATADDDNPQGYYWPSLHNEQKKDAEFVTIGDTSYNDIQELEDYIEENDDTVYLGHFINDQKKTIYLYGSPINTDDDDTTDQDN